MPTADSSDSSGTRLRSQIRQNYSQRNAHAGDDTTAVDTTAVDKQSVRQSMQAQLLGTATTTQRDSRVQKEEQQQSAQQSAQQQQDSALLREAEDVGVTEHIETPAEATASIPTNIQLDVAEQVIQETEARRESAAQVAAPQPPNDPTAQAFPQAVQQQYQQQLNPPHATSSGQREAIGSPTSPDFGGIDQIPGIQSVEQEPNPELSPEVASFLEKAEQHQDQLPEEISIADEQVATTPPRRTAKKPVVVLPITPEVEERGKRKSPAFSIRWLVEWSRKIMKMFHGDVIYRQTQ